MGAICSKPTPTTEDPTKQQAEGQSAANRPSITKNKDAKNPIQKEIIIDDGLIEKPLEGSR